MHKSPFKVMSQLLVFVFPLMHMMFITIFLGTIGYLATTAISVLGAYALFNTFNMNLALWMLALVLIASISKYFEQLSGHYIAFKLLADMRDQVFNKLRQLAPAKLEGKDKGNLIAMITSDIELIEVFYAHTIAPLFIAFFTSSVMVIFLSYYHFTLGILAFIAYLTIGVFIPILNHKKGKATGLNYRNAFGGLSDLLFENTRGIFEILQYNQGEARKKGLNEASDRLSEENKKLKFFEGQSKAITEMFLLFFGLATLFLSLYLNALGAVRSQDLLIITVAMLGSFGPTVALSSLSNDLMQTLASADRLLSLLEESPIVAENQVGEMMPRHDVEGIRVEDVCFSYDQTPILEGVNAVFKKGSITGIYGKSGSGKSTLLKLMMRFWPNDEGRILYEGQGGRTYAIESLQTASLRNLTSYMTQETYLFNGTLRDNMIIGKINATDQEIVEAAKKAAIHDFIMTLPEGYHSQVGEMGRFLSGGERQRIGLARAFLSDAPIMLLDEPTSNLDSLNEALLLDAVEKSSKDKCVILVSHRQSTLAFADQILKMSGGRNS